MKKKSLQNKADTEFVDFLVTGGVGGEDVEVDFGTGGEDKPAALGADGSVETELVELCTLGSHFREIESGSDTNIPTMLVVLVDVAEFDGHNDGTEGSGLLFTVEVGAGERVGKFSVAEEVAVGEVGEAIAEADVDIPAFGDGAMVVEGYADVGANAVVETIVSVHAAVGDY